MTFHLDIPESVAQSLRLPAPEVVPRLRTELAVALYARGILSFGKASEFAEASRFAFADLVAQRDIPRHYTEDELTQDLDYARRQYHLSPFKSGRHRTPRSPQITALGNLDP